MSDDFAMSESQELRVGTIATANDSVRFHPYDPEGERIEEGL
jgi:hypothetical protein